MLNIRKSFNFPKPNRRLAESFSWQVLRSKTSLRSLRLFLKALNFSLNDFRYLMILEVKNEALKQSFYSTTQHLSLLKLSSN